MFCVISGNDAKVSCFTGTQSATVFRSLQGPSNHHIPGFALTNMLQKFPGAGVMRETLFLRAKFGRMRL